MYVIIGWFNVAAIVIMTAPYWMREINKLVFHNKNKAIVKIIGILRMVHKPLGVALLVLAIAHGILALGAMRLHTGTIVGIFLISTVSLGGLFYRLKKKPLFIAHRTAALILVVFLLVHLIVPSAIYYLLGL